MQYKWPLNVNNTIFLDKLKLAKFILTNDRWTQGSKVKELETKMAAYTGAKYAVFVSSGSTANSIVSMYCRDSVFSKERNIAVFPSTTWTTSVSCFVRDGFKPHFIDIDNNFCMDSKKLESYLNRNHKKVAVVFITSLLGFSFSKSKLLYLQKKFSNIKFAQDNCEASQTKDSYQNLNINNGDILSTTSTYMGHYFNSIEGGFLFTNDETEYKYFLMYRNHGMVRSLNIYGDEDKDAEYRIGYENLDVDNRFDFNCLGNNFRNSEFNAMVCLLDLERADKYEEIRKSAANYFYERLDSNKYEIFGFDRVTPFSLPIILKEDNDNLVIENLKNFCINNKFETRPIISGFLGYQSAFKPYFKKYRNCQESFPRSIKIDNDGLYLGLHSKVKQKNIDILLNYLNKI